MEWLATHLEKVLLGLVGLLFLAFFFGAVRFDTPDWRRWKLAVPILVFGAFAVWRFLVAPPVDKGGSPVPLDPDRVIDLSASHLDRLRAPWDSSDDPRWPVAETLALACEIAYEAPVNAEERFAKLGLDRCEPLFHHSMVGYLASHDDVAVVAFRGTDFNEWSDWGVNKRIVPEPTNDGPIHSGFNRAYDGLSDQVRKLLGRRKPAHLWVTGHSLGGALATVCAYRLESQSEPTLKGLMTFGQPMVAKIELAKHLDGLLAGRYAWFVNGKDLVPKSPLFYEPAGEMVWMRGANDVVRWRRRSMTYASQPGEGEVAESFEPPCPLPPLTPEEQEMLKSELSEAPPDLFDPPTARFTSFGPTDHHMMPAYLDSLRSMLGVVDNPLP